MIRDRTKRGRVERKKEGDRQVERQKFIQAQWVTRPPGHLGWDVESASCLPHSEEKKNITKNLSHQALIRRHPQVSFKFGLYFLQSKLSIGNLKMGEKRTRFFACKSLMILIQPILSFWHLC